MSSTFSPFNSQFGGSLPSFGGGARGFSFRQTTRLNDQNHENAMAILDKLHEHALAEGAQGHTNMENLTRMQHFHEANESAKTHAASQTLQDTMATHLQTMQGLQSTHEQTLEGLRGQNEQALEGVKGKNAVDLEGAQGRRERAARRGEAAAHTIETDNEIRKNKKASKQIRKTQQQAHVNRLEAETQAPKTLTRMSAGSTITTTTPEGHSTSITKGAPNAPAKKAPAKKTAPKPPKPPRP